MAEDPAPPFDDSVLLAVVLSAHGLKGEVRVKVFAEDADALKNYGVLTCGDGRQFEITAMRVAKAGEALVMFKGFADRNAAENLKGQRLYVPRGALPEPEEEEFYHADLVGMAAEDEGGVRVGTITAVHNFGAGDVIEIVSEDRASRFISFTRAAVPIVDLAAKRVVLADLPEAE